MPKEKIAGVDVVQMAEDDEFIKTARLDPNGHEVLDPTPMYPTVGWQDPPTLEEMIRNFIRGEQVRAAAEAEGYETFEEADDFEVGDDYEPYSPHENDDQEPVSVLRERQAAAEAAAASPPPPPAQTAPAAAPAAPAAPVEPGAGQIP